jgi:thiol-disulfide isomerase/thioredoxin
LYSGARKKAFAFFRCHDASTPPRRSSGRGRLTGGSGFTPLDRAEAQRLLSADKHRQPTVVTLWSSDCGYCKANLKLLSSLTRNNRKLRVITVAAEPENAHLWPMLSRCGLAGPHHAYGSDSPEAIAYAIDLTGAASCPVRFCSMVPVGKKEFPAC